MPMQHKGHCETISTFELLTSYFPTEQSVVDLIAKRRWSKGHDCPHCGTVDQISPFMTKQRIGHYRCRACRKVHSIRTGTIFECSPIELRKWIYAMYKNQTARKGVSALQLSKEIGVTHKTAWFMLHRLRHAQGSEQAAIEMMLDGNVEIDELFIGGLEKNKHADKKMGVGGGAGGKQAVLGFRSRKTGNVTLIPISDRTRKTLHGRIRNHVKEDSIIHTDEWTGYAGIDSEGEYVHYKVNHSAGEFVRRLASGGIASTNAIESVFAVVRRGFMGIYHNWRAKYGWRYLNEFAFRLNQGNVAIDTLDRLDSLLDAMIGTRLTFAELTANG